MNFKQTWWDKNLPTQKASFDSWIGTSEAVSKKYIRKHIEEEGYSSVIDLGCGTATEYFALKEELPHVGYLGVDSSKHLFDLNTKRGVRMILASAEDTGLEADTVEFVFCRHVLEHQPDFKPILQEMIRLASKEAVHVFFVKPSQAPTLLNYNDSENLYHNLYNINEIEEFLQDKVESWTWKDLGVESVLHIKTNK